MQPLSHFADINQCIEEGVKKHCPLHKDLAKTQLKRDAKAVALALTWLEENTGNPFDYD